MKALRSLPKVIAFDIDGTLWDPDMYMTSGAPMTPHNNGEYLTDRAGDKVKFCHDTREILAMLSAHPDVVSKRTLIVTASTCDYPDWGRECLQKFTFHCSATNRHRPINDIFHHHEIRTMSSKHTHFANIKKVAQQHFADGFELTEAIFFDNQMNNIRDISKLGVKCVYVPQGLTWAAFNEHCARL